jgi:hypothetical protein
VVLELTLPDMSGFQALMQLVPRAYYPELAVIFLSRTTLQTYGRNRDEEWSTSLLDQVSYLWR